MRAEHSEEQMDLRMGCLRERWSSSSAAVNALARTDGQVVDKATKVVSGLPGLAGCDDVDRLYRERQRVPPPADPRVVREVEALREQLMNVDAERKLGVYEGDLERVESAVMPAEALGYPPLLAEAKLRRGLVRDDAGQYAEAEHELVEAHVLAVECGHDAVVFEAARRLAHVVGYEQARHAEGLLWGRIAASLARYSGDATKMATSMGSLGNVYFGRGNYEEAAHQYQQALELEEHTWGEDDPLVVYSANNLGKRAVQSGRVRGSEALVLASAADHRAVVGRRAPDGGV